METRTFNPASVAAPPSLNKLLSSGAPAPAVSKAKKQPHV
jgi:hypothetical protein